MEEIIMHLNSPWFELMRDGKKIYEGRRNTPKISKLQRGQMIKMQHYIDNTIEPFRVVVENVLFYPTFESALQDLPLYDVLPLDDITIEQGVEIYKKYVSLNTQTKDGVIMLKVSRLYDYKQVVQKNTDE